MGDFLLNYINFSKFSALAAPKCVTLTHFFNFWRVPLYEPCWKLYNLGKACYQTCIKRHNYGKISHNDFLFCHILHPTLWNFVYNFAMSLNTSHWLCILRPPSLRSVWGFESRPTQILFLSKLISNIIASWG